VAEQGLPYTKKYTTLVWRAFEWKILVYFIAIWNIFRPLGIGILWPFGHFVVIWYDLPILVNCTKKNLATLDRTLKNRFEMDAER
jgi:hypothetical protein